VHTLAPSAPEPLHRRRIWLQLAFTSAVQLDPANGLLARLSSQRDRATRRPSID
jgi:hypothetical protein